MIAVASNMFLVFQCLLIVSGGVMAGMMPKQHMERMERGPQGQGYYSKAPEYYTTPATYYTTYAAPQYYTTTYAAPSYYTEAPKYSYAKEEYYATKKAEYYEAPKYTTQYSAPSYSYTTAAPYYTPAYTTKSYYQEEPKYYQRKSY